MIALVLAAAALAVPPDLASRLDRHLERLVPFGFAGAALIAREGTVLLEEGYGLADREKGIPWTKDTAVSVGSITKQFTAAAVLKLEAEGKLAVGDPLARHLPDVPEDKRSITLHHLLTHTAGLESDFAGDYEPVGRDEYVARALAAPLLSPPGEAFHYANSGYSLLAAVVERVSGKAYEAYLQEALFRPAGMTRTGYRVPRWAPQQIPRGYREGTAWGTMLDRPWAEDGPYWALRGNGGIQTTLHDLFRWDRALRAGTVLPAAQAAKLVAPHVKEPGGESHYGYGWSVARSPRGTRVAMHNGGNGIFSADYLRDLDEGVVIVTASSVSEVNASDLTPRLAAMLFGREVEDPPAVAPAAPGALAPLAGRYRLPGGGRLDVTVSGSGLEVAAEGIDAWNLLAAPRPSAPPVVAGPLVERTMRLAAAAQRGDYKPLQEAFGSGIPPGEVAAVEARMAAERRAAFGDPRGVHVLGAVRGDDPKVVRVVVKLAHERGAPIVQYAWEGGHLRAIRAGPPARPAAFLPSASSPGTFVAYDVGEGQSRTLRFEEGALVLGDARAVRLATGEDAP